MAGGEERDAGLSAARHPAPWSDLATHRPGHAELAHIAAQLAAASDPRSVIMTAEVLRILLRPWAVGFVGEETVGIELALLDPGWRVLHSVTISRNGTDIDHLVIGPPGIFTIDTKHHAGAHIDVRSHDLFVGSKRTRYVRKARHEAQRVRAALAADLPAACPVTPIICTVGATLSHQEASEGFRVLADQQLVPALSALTPVLTPERVERLYERARRSTTWAPTGPPPAAPLEVATFARELAAAARAGRAAARPTQAVERRLGLATPSAPPSSQGAPRRSGTSRSLGAPAGLRQHRALALLAVVVALLLAGPAVGQGARFMGALFPLSTIGTEGQASAYQASADLPIQAPLASCAVEQAQGRTLLGSQLLTCQRNDADELAWEYANPWRRLPVALQGTRCVQAGSHARNFALGDSALACTASDDGQDRWIEDPDWTPPL